MLLEKLLELLGALFTLELLLLLRLVGMLLEKLLELLGALFTLDILLLLRLVGMFLEKLLELLLIVLGAELFRTFWVELKGAGLLFAKLLLRSCLCDS